ncbi:MAG: CatB-related O-acetyltransferase [Alphaproteobacteria bacterium]|nr:CatB-related O-acetyltransferase [Alphaproteobacteria bacterium]
MRNDKARKLAFKFLRLAENQFTSQRLRRVYRDWFGVEVGLYSYGCFDPARFPPGTRFGRYCSIANTAASFDTDHPVDAAILHPVAYHPGFGVVDAWRIAPTPLVVEDDVWLGHNVTILAGTGRIGRGAIVAAGAVVREPVAPYMIVAGIPARPIRPRFGPERIASLEASHWWERTPPELRHLTAQHADWLPEAASRHATKD